nr:immunoglobulin heavy chain junction region [Mus musculus]
CAREGYGHYLYYYAMDYW